MRISLENAGIGQVAVVSQVLGGAGMTRHLKILGISEGKRIRVISKHPGRGPIVVEVNSGSRIAIGRGMAQRILVDVHT
jgi:Fe2+ transport system protein FeoA